MTTREETKLWQQRYGKVAYAGAWEPFLRFRFHDLRHQAITEIAENGAPDATVMALAGHLSREMMENLATLEWPRNLELWILCRAV